MRFIQFFALLFVGTYACNSQTPVTQIAHSNNKMTLILDSLQATTVILKDKKDLFFERVTLTEMSIQMKRPLKPTDTREGLLPYYQGYLQGDMADFTPAESQWVASIMRNVFETCNKVASDIFPDSLILIKTHGQHYGYGVYYTRENCIVIPEDVLRRKDKASFTSTMYHEIFHVYSRLHPAKSSRLYQLIGFQHVGLDHIKMPAPLAAQVLHNPDGVDFGQKIMLINEMKDTVYAIPIIYANENGFQSAKSEFFAYLEFSLFQIKLQKDGFWMVQTMTDGLSSTLNMNKVPDFFRQIRDNTSYIIHPDEVLADNFSFIMLDLDGKMISKKFSPEGKKLLVEIEQILKE